LPSSDDNKKGCRHKGPRLENVDESTADAFHALGQMMHANRLAVARMSADSGANHREIVALALVCQQDGLTQKELGEILHLSPPRVSIIVDSLAESGSVERRTDNEDRRVVRLYATAEGRQREKSQRDLLGDYVNRTIGALPAHDRIELARLLRELAERTMTVLQDGSHERGVVEAEDTR